MEIFVASTSEQKVPPARESANDIFGIGKSTVEGKNTKSGVNANPETKKDDDETLRGACNRIDDLKNIIGETRYDLLVAFESGIRSEKIGERIAWFDFCWVVVEDTEGKRYYAQSPGIEIDEDIVAEARAAGLEHTTIGDILARRAGGKANEPQSKLTSNLVKRSELLKASLKTILGQIFKKISSKITL